MVTNPGRNGLRARRAAALALALMPPVSPAADAAPDRCYDEAVLEHVLTQFEFYGPRSDTAEYFGFIYVKDGLVRGSVTSGMRCRGQRDCAVNPVFALRRIPAGAKVLGEWHTHTRGSAHELSPEDVRGARANLHIRCYSAFYSTPDGNIWRWDPAQSTIAGAMASRASVGMFRWR